MKKPKGRCCPQTHCNVLGSSGGTHSPCSGPEKVVQTELLCLFPALRSSHQLEANHLLQKDFKCKQPYSR